MTNEELQEIEDNAIRHAGDVATIRCKYLPALIVEVERLQENVVRLEHYRQFVAQISEALGVPDDSMILPHAQEMAAEITRLRAELAAVPVDAIRRNMYDQADAAEYRQIRDWLGI